MGMALVEDNLFDKGYEDELSIAQRDWARMQKRSLTQGYRAGVSEGAEVRLQAAFDTAYTRVFTRARQCGRVRGRIAAKKLINNDEPEIIQLINCIEQELNSFERTTSASITELENISLRLTSQFMI